MKYIHILKPESGNQFTLAYTKPNENKEVNVGVAICSKKDQFSRPMGRRVAESRISNLRCNQATYTTNGYTLYVFFPNFFGSKKNNYWKNTKASLEEAITKLIRRICA